LYGYILGIPKTTRLNHDVEIYKVLEYQAAVEKSLKSFNENLVASNDHDRVTVPFA
jgi:hypothetical protein